MKKETRAENAGIKMAEAIVEFVHMMYNKSTAKRVLSAVIKKLKEGIKEFN